MNVLFYLPVTSEIDARIQEVVEMARSMAKTEVFRSIKDLSIRLCGPTGSPTIAVLLAGNKIDLVDFAFIRNLLSDTPIILVLPDREESTAIIGYALVPRFLTYMDSNLMEVGAVLEKMIQYYENRSVMEEQEIDSDCELLVTR
jgi:ATP-dependent 26S proteasome regulatory subunit